MIKVLIVDDSAVVRSYLAHILNSDPDIQVVGQAENGSQALEFLGSQQPDVITMDIEMPVMDGLEATRRIMESVPVPIVIVSANWEPINVNVTFKAIEAGAVSLMTKPAGLGSPDHSADTAELITLVKNAAVAHVHKLKPRRVPDKNINARSLTVLKNSKTLQPVRIVAIGASTGGPPVIRQILDSLPRDFPVPIVLVQHISRGFTRGFVDWLDQMSLLRVYVATQGEYIHGGRVYVAPEGFQMGVSNFGSIVLSDDPPEHSVRPSVSYLFRSAARVYRAAAVGILLTGMGVDGAAELNLIREAGGTTFAQDQKTSVVHGMPGAAIRLGAVDHILNPGEIAARLVDLVAKS